MNHLFLTQTEHTPRGLRVTCRGELDVLASRTLTQAIWSALAEGPHELIVDLRRLTFCEPRSLGRVLDLARELRSDGRRVEVKLHPRDERLVLLMRVPDGSEPVPTADLNQPLIDLSSADVPVVTVRRRSEMTEITCVGPLQSVGLQKMIEAVERELAGGPRTIVFDLTRVSPILSGSSRLVSELASTCLRAGLAVEIKGNFRAEMPEGLGVSNG